MLIVRNAELHRDVGGRGGGQRGRRDWDQNQVKVSRDKRREEHKQPQDRAHESIGPLSLKCANRDRPRGRARVLVEVPDDAGAVEIRPGVAARRA
jgi:hypothetical protein